MLNTTNAGRLATSARDRVDSLLLGRPTAARLRVARLFDAKGASRRRSAAYAGIAAPAWVTEGLPIARTERVQGVRARVATLLAA
ncbi:MAG TPA: hypothetical protein VGA98_11315 [Allosphingosinicella sp.]|jgi:hypothetical protein